MGYNRRMLSVPKTMQAVVYRGPGDLRLETIPVPRIGPGELLVKVAVCGVCPTDIKKILHGTVPPPRVFGHETAGTIVRVGARVRGWRPGERVALHHHVPCGDCHFCRHGVFAQCRGYKRTGVTAGFEPAGGGYAEYVRVLPFALPGVVRIPPENSFEEGALLEPVNTVLKAVRRLGLQRGDQVLVAGQGPIGLLFTGLLRLEGAQVLASDLLPERLRLARRYGARWTWRVRGGDPDTPAVSSVARRAGATSRRGVGLAGPRAGSSIRDGAAASGLAGLVYRVTRRRGLDAAVVAVPSDAVVREALGLLRGGGRLLLFAHTTRGDALTVDPSAVCVDEKDLLGSYSADITLQEEVARLVFTRRLDVRPLITHRFPLRRTAEAIALAARPKAGSLKIVVTEE